VDAPLSQRQKRRMTKWLPLLAICVAACASSSAPVDSRAAAEPVVAAERAFAARHQQVSVKRSFLEYAAPDGVMLTPDGVRNAQEFISTWPDDDDTGLIKWWPSLAGIARSGDLGFTTGPADFGGGKRFTNYFTIWKKQPDGSWKWMIDLGTRKGTTPAGAPGDPVTIVPVSYPAPMDPAKAWSTLKARDRIIRDPLFRGDPESIAGYYAFDALLLGWEDGPRSGHSAVIEVNRKRGPIAEEHEGGGVSAAGDLGWTYGFARWNEGGQEKAGAYLRVWQRRDTGWVVLVENSHAF
jgi:ketosteroid isomerase-like protein